MSSDKSYNKSGMKNRWRSSFKPIATHLTRPSKKIGAKRGFHDQFLIANWRDIVGNELGKLTRPRSMTTTRSGGSTLILESVGAYVAELTMRSEEIRMKVNSALGRDAIKKIQFVHQAVGFAEPKKEFLAKPAIKREPPSDLRSGIDKTQSSALKDALSEISKAYYLKEGSK